MSPVGSSRTYSNVRFPVAIGVQADINRVLFKPSVLMIHALDFLCLRRPSLFQQRPHYGSGAIAALECVLNDPGWNPPSTYPGEDFQRHLIAAARDYIKRMAAN